MALKIKTTLIFILFLSNLLASTDLDLFFTDRYDSNFFSSSKISNSKLNIGSDLFRFVENEDLHVFGNFIDSFLKTEEVSFNQNIEYNGFNTLEIELFNSNAIKCGELSEIWFEGYNISWIKLLKAQLKLENIKEDNSQLMIFKKLYEDEIYRPFHPGNIVNNTQLAFVIPQNLSKNNFKQSKIFLNNKRYNGEESDLNYTEIISNDILKPNEIIFNFPSVNKSTLLKNSISMYILKRLLDNKHQLDLSYGISQSFAKYTLKTDSINLREIKLNLEDISIPTESFNAYRDYAINEILNAITEKNLFFFSYYDKAKLKQMKELYLPEDFQQQINILENKDKFNIELSPNNNLLFQQLKLEEIHHSDFVKGIDFKPNSIDFTNEEDTLLLGKLNLFLALNQNYNLSIISSSKKSEYLFISKKKKEAIIDQYEESGYFISQSKKLKLYRSLIVFNELIKLKSTPTRLKCIGIRNNQSKVNFEFIMSN